MDDLDFIQEHIGIEDDHADDQIDSKYLPFNPRDLSMSTKLMTMDALVRRFRQKSLILDPGFQRKEVWNPIQKSRLIESLLLRIPIPMFYFSSDVKNNYTVIDGLQRLSAIRDYVVGRKSDTSKANSDNNFCGDGEEAPQLIRLVGLEYLKDFEGKTINELPTEFYNQLMETEFSVTIIEPKTPEEVKRNVFKRINTGGLPLSDQEIRNALYTGPATELLRELVKTPTFLEATGGGLHSLRADDQEIVLRLLSFIIRTPEEYKEEAMNTWLSVTMQIINYPKEISKELQELIKEGKVKPSTIEACNREDLARKFELGMSRAKRLFGDHAFRKSTSGKRSPITKALFEMWGSLLSGLDDNQFETLLHNKAHMMEEYKYLLRSDEFNLLIGKRSSTPASVKERFNIIRKLITKNTSL